MASSFQNTALLQKLSSAAYSLNNKYDSLLKAVGDAQFVLIGEESHGTHDFYHHRAEITKKLITEKDFNFVAVEGDWPDSYKINRYVNGIGNAKEAFSEFKRFPRWMWRNEVVLNFANWLKNYNTGRNVKAGFYGLDLYSLFNSADAVLQYLKKEDPEAYQKAKKRYGCFGRFDQDTQKYAYKTSFGMSKSCEEEVKKQLMDMLEQYGKKEYLTDEEAWCAKMNSQVVKDAEEYYRKMFTDLTWNIRDQHMSNTLDDIVKHYSTKVDGKVKAVIWAHNSHLGDARETEMGKRRKELNLGQLTRERYGIKNTFNIGFCTYTGQVTAADEWDDPGEVFNVNPGMKGSYEELMHNVYLNLGNNFWLIFRSNAPQSTDLNVVSQIEGSKNMLQRAIGVVYKPATERYSHYFAADLPRQFDAYIHIDVSKALQPLDKGAQEWSGDIENTLPPQIVDEAEY